MKKIIAFFLGGMLVLLFSGVLEITSASAKNDDIRLKIFVHYPKPPGKPILPTCQVTTDDQVNDWLPTGWQIPTAGVIYKINLASKPRNLTNNQITTAVSASFNTWSAADSKQIFTYDGSTSAKNAKRDNTNAILFKKITRSALAMTYIWYYPSTGELVEIDTIFNTLYQWSYTAYTGTNDCGGAPGTYDIQNIGTHEFGHWVGLNDLYDVADKDLTMYGYGDTQELKADTLGLGDITGVNSIAP